MGDKKSNNFVVMTRRQKLIQRFAYKGREMCKMVGEWHEVDMMEEKLQENHLLSGPVSIPLIKKKNFVYADEGKKEVLPWVVEFEVMDGNVVDYFEVLEGSMMVGMLYCFQSEAYRNEYLHYRDFEELDLSKRLRSGRMGRL